MSTRGDLESAVTEASQMARVAHVFISEGLRLSYLNAAPLTRGEIDLLLFAVVQTCLKIEEAEKVFFDLSD